MTHSAARALATYQEVTVTSRSPLELVVMLYDGLLAALRHAHDAMGRKDLFGKRNGLHKALVIVEHLQGTLDMEGGGEAASHLDEFYRQVTGLVLGANLDGDQQQLAEAVRLVASIRDAWQQLAAAPVVLPSSQSVTAGAPAR